MQYSDSNVRLHPTWTKRWNILKKSLAYSLSFVQKMKKGFVKDVFGRCESGRLGQEM